jgi:hypothetical protein
MIVPIYDECVSLQEYVSMRCLLFGNYPISRKHIAVIRKNTNFLYEDSHIDNYGQCYLMNEEDDDVNLVKEHHSLKDVHYIGCCDSFIQYYGIYRCAWVFFIFNFIKNEFNDIRHIGSIPYEQCKYYEPHLINVYYVDNLQKETILNQIVKILEKYPLYFFNNESGIYHKRPKYCNELQKKRMTAFEKQHPYKSQIECIYEYHNDYSIARDIYPMIRQDFLDIKNAILNIKQVDSLMITCLKQLVCKDAKNEELRYLFKHFHVPHIEKYCKRLREIYQTKVEVDCENKS